jgi:hypothetical protein
MQKNVIVRLKKKPHTKNDQLTECKMGVARKMGGEMKNAYISVRKYEGKRQHCDGNQSGNLI